MRIKRTLRFSTPAVCVSYRFGELAGRLSDEARSTGIPWHAIRAMRNLHAHDYDNVDLAIVWDTLENDILVLEQKLSLMLQGE